MGRVGSVSSTRPGRRLTSAHLSRRGRGRGERIEVAAEDRGVAAGAVRCAWWPHAAHYGVREGEKSRVGQSGA